MRSGARRTRSRNSPTGISAKSTSCCSRRKPTCWRYERPTDVSSFSSSTETIPDAPPVPRHVAIIMDGNGRSADAGPISERELAQLLSMSYAPEPDLFIRTGGEQRISNFLLWQLAYTELYFTETLWPDFDAAALDAAIRSYQRRERRFGRTSEQLLESMNLGKVAQL